MAVGLIGRLLAAAVLGVALAGCGTPTGDAPGTAGTRTMDRNDPRSLKRQAAEDQANAPKGGAKGGSKGQQAG